MYANRPCYTIDVTELFWLPQACNVNIVSSVPANLHQTYLLHQLYPDSSMLRDSQHKFDKKIIELSIVSHLTTFQSV